MHTKRICGTLACLAVMLSGCRSANDVIADYVGTAQAGYDVSQVEADPELAAMVPDSMKKDGKLVVGTNLTWAPAEFKIGSEPAGYEMDMMRALAARLDLELVIEDTEFDSLLPSIPSRYEVGAAAITITPERLAAFDMIQFYTVGTSWAVRKNNPSGFSPENICGHSIGVQSGTVQDDEIAELSEACTDKPDVQRYDSQEAITQALQGGKIETMASDSSVIEYAIKNTGNTLETVGDITGTSPQGIVVPKDPQTTQAIQAALQSLMDDGTLKDIFATWGLTKNVATEALINPVVE